MILRPRRGAICVAAGITGVLGCTGEIGEVELVEAPEIATDPGPQALVTGNGLISVNGLTSDNGLISDNGLTADNGLTSDNGLKSGVGLMTSPGGRTTIAYLVKCALPAGKQITKKDQYGKSYTFAGSIGVGRGWENGACDSACKRWVTACILAHINTTGTSLSIWVVADPAKQPQIGWGRSSTYPNQEGSFFGNIFVSPPQAYYCGGRNIEAAAVAGRLGAGSNGAPYTDPWGPSGACQDHCIPAESPYAQSGFKNCNGNDAVMTVWRKATY